MFSLDRQGAFPPLWSGKAGLFTTGDRAPRRAVTIDQRVCV